VFSIVGSIVARRLSCLCVDAALRHTEVIWSFGGSVVANK
jgi:hypothetical protein